MTEDQPFHKLKPEAYRLLVSDDFTHPDDAEGIEQTFADILSGKSSTYKARRKAGNSALVRYRT